MSETIQDLRTELFATLRGLRDEKNPLDIARAKAIADVAKVIVDSAKAENEYIKLTDQRGSGFIPPLIPAQDPALKALTGGKEKK